MTDIQLLAFVITPLTALAFGAAVAVWAIRVAERERKSLK